MQGVIPLRQLPLEKLREEILRGEMSVHTHLTISYETQPQNI